MAGTERRTDAVRFYRRTLGEVAAHQVVAAAEDIVGDKWIDELEQTRRRVLGRADPVNRADHTARESLRQAQERGDPSAVVRAQARLSEVIDDQILDLDRIRAAVEAVDAQLERGHAAAAERTRQTRRELGRLRAAWTDAYGG
jgi:hypothetical protein